MSRALLIGLALALALIGLALLSGDIVALALLPLALLGAALLDAPPAPSISAERQITPDRTAQGQPAEVLVRITNHGGDLRELLVSDQIPRGVELIDGAAERRAPLPGGATLELRYTVRGVRGLYHFAELRATLADRLGIYPAAHSIAAPGALFVLPDLVRLRQIALRPRRTRVYAGQIAARQGGSGIDFFGVRPYQPGDPARRLNARLAARRPDELFVNEFEQERVADVGIILDARSRADVRGAGGSLFEHSVQAAAALGDSLLAQGNRVGLLIYGNAIEWTFPGYGKVQRERLLRALAAARPGDRLALETLENIPERLFPTRTLLVLISALLPDDVKPVARLRARGYQLVVISPDPIEFERAELGLARESAGARAAIVERELLLRRLRQSGVPIVSWAVGTPFALAAAQALGRHERQ